MKRALNAILSSSWAIQPEALETIIAVAERESEYHGNLEALEAKLGRPLGNTMVATVRDGVAIIPVEGPMFAKANLMTEFSGATSYQMLALDITKAFDDAGVRAVMLSVSSPGGEVEGASELAALIRAKAAETQKPVYAHIGGHGASAAYWIASAARRIYAADTAIVGGIGVQSAYTIRDARPGEKTYRFVSSQSPLKNASPASDEGAARIQANVDALAQVFLDTVARNRNKNPSDAVQWSGLGAVFVAKEALELGLIDEIATFEQALQAISEEKSMDWNKLTAADLRANRADLVAEIEAAAVAAAPKPDVEAIRAEAAAAERARIAEIEALAMPGTEDLVAKFKADGTAPAAAAIEIIKAAKANPSALAATADAGAQHLAGLKQTEASLQKPEAGSGKDAAAEDDIDAAAAAALEQARKAGVNV